MRMSRLSIVLSAASCVLGVSVVTQAADRPDWAYPVNPPPPATWDNVKTMTVPGSQKQYTMSQVNDGFGPPDWYPEEHPPMPHVVSNGGPRPAAPACALCHLTSGDGHPESADIAGQPEDYIIRQMVAFKDGERNNVRATAMINMAKVLSDSEIKESARYFASLKPRPGYYKVVETQSPKLIWALVPCALPPKMGRLNRWAIASSLFPKTLKRWICAILTLGSLPMSLLGALREARNWR
jgi:cytochrome c553